jgi:hypothetical protein
MRTFAKLSIIAGFVMLITASIFGQNTKIAVVHNGSSTFYTNLTPALTAAQSGDTIYLPGGPLLPDNIVINKPLTIVGAGHFPDSSIATNPTFIKRIYFKTGADGGQLIGITCNELQWGYDGSQNVNNIIIKQCKIDLLYPNNHGGGTSTSQNILFTENVIYSTSSGGFSSVLFEKNIFSNCTYSQSAQYNNCIFIFNHFISFNYSTLNNNIFYNTDTDWNEHIQIQGTQNILSNNLFCANTYPYNTLSCESCIMNNNPILEQSTVNTFINVSGSNFSYSNNYHLKETSPGINAGTDGTDVGIYGTQYPAKDGAVPFNPHISSKNISTQVSPSGVLNVDVKVSAQDR